MYGGIGAVVGLIYYFANSSASPLENWASKYQNPQASVIHTDLVAFQSAIKSHNGEALLASCTQGQASMARIDAQPLPPNRQLRVAYQAELNDVTSIYNSCFALISATSTSQTNTDAQQISNDVDNLPRDATRVNTIAKSLGFSLTPVSK